MANLVYGDPFGSYVKGQEAGQKQAIELGEAQRKFRESDREADFKKWYDPYRRDETQAQVYIQQMKAWQEHAQSLWGAAQSGDKRAISAFEDFFQQSFGYRPDLTRPTPEQSAWIIGAISRGVPGAATNPEVGQAGPHGVVMYRNFGGGAGASGIDPWRQLNSDWGQGGTGTGTQGQPGDIHTLPNLLTGPNPYNPAPIQPDNTNSGIPVGDITPRAFPPTSVNQGEENTSEFSYANRDTLNEPRMPHYDQGSVAQNTARMAGEPDPQEPSFYNPTNDGRNAANVPMRGNQVSFARPEDTAPNATTSAASPQFAYPPAGQYPAPIRLTSNPTIPSQNRPTPGKQVWADSSETPATSGPTFQHNRRSSPKQMVTQ